MPEITLQPTDEDAVLKEVWNVHGIEAKTELTDEQIHNVNLVLTLSDIFGNALIHEHANKFMKLQKSRNRKSMEEFVNVVRAKREDFVQKGKSWFNTLTG